MRRWTKTTTTIKAKKVTAAMTMMMGLLLPPAHADRSPTPIAKSPDRAALASESHEVQAVKELLLGEYDSSAQQARDRDYFTITLRMVECWKQRSDGPWIYVEQATESAPDKPYRQRVYRLVAMGAGMARSEVYELPGAPEEVVAKFAGQWRADKPLADVTPEQLKARQGCAITLTRQADESWTGATRGKECSSSLRGASYATSEVRLTRGLLRTWDRGFDKADQQVWGAKKGPYEFVRRPAAMSPAPAHK